MYTEAYNAYIRYIHRTLAYPLRKREDFIPVDDPLRQIRQIVNVGLTQIDALLSEMCEVDTEVGTGF